MLQCAAVRSSVLQCVAVRCSALQCVAVRCSALHTVFNGGKVPQVGYGELCKVIVFVEALANAVERCEGPEHLQCVAACCSVLQCCSALQRVESVFNQDPCQCRRTM